MPIANPPDLSYACIEAFMARFNDPNKGFNVQYAVTQLIPKYSQLPNLIIDGNFTTPPLSQNLVIGKYDIDFLIKNSIFTPPGFQIYTDRLMGQQPGTGGAEKNRQFGGLCMMTIDTHLTWPGPPNIPLNMLANAELLMSSIELTLSACFCFPYARGNTYQSWPAGINFSPASFSRTLTSPARTGGIGLMQLVRFTCLWDLQL